MMNRRSDKIPTSSRSSNPQWQKRQQLPPLPPPRWKLPAQVLTLNSTTQRQQQQLIPQDQYVVEEQRPNVQWPSSSAAAYGAEQKLAAYNLWHWQQKQQQEKLLLERQQQEKLLLERQQRLLLEQQQQPESYMNSYVNQLILEAPPRPYPRRDQGGSGGGSRLTAFLERDESFLTPWGKRDVTVQGGEFNSGEYARVDGERQPEKMVFEYGSSCFSNRLY